MAFGHQAEAWERDILQAVFGLEVKSALFWDADDPAGGWTLVQAFSADDIVFDSCGLGDPRWSSGRADDGASLTDIPGNRGSTVKFFLIL